MLRRLFRQAALAALIGIGITAQARADGVPGYIVQPPDRLTTSVIVPTDPLNPNPPKRFGCWASHFGSGCGSFRSDMVFIFGSCRSFYGEGCRKDPPSIYQPGYGPAYPVGPGAGGFGAGANRGCNCQ